MNSAMAIRHRGGAIAAARLLLYCVQPWLPLSTAARWPPCNALVMAVSWSAAQTCRVGGVSACLRALAASLDALQPLAASPSGASEPGTRRFGGAFGVLKRPDYAWEKAKKNYKTRTWIALQGDFARH